MTNSLDDIALRPHDGAIQHIRFDFALRDGVLVAAIEARWAA